MMKVTSLTVMLAAMAVGISACGDQPKAPTQSFEQIVSRCVEADNRVGDYFRAALEGQPPTSSPEALRANMQSAITSCRLMLSEVHGDAREAPMGEGGGPCLEGWRLKIEAYEAMLERPDDKASADKLIGAARTLAECEAMAE